MKSFETLMAQEQPKLLNCVHCGLCLDECPTYRLSGDENNSPRGRLALWRALWEGRLKPDSVTDFYTDECLGCLACVPACPANVPYGDLLAEARREQARQSGPPSLRLRLGAWLASRPALFRALALPLRAARRLGLGGHPALLPGSPALLEGTAAYARRAAAQLCPRGPRVALFTGCLMEALTREINFASIRVLMANGFQVEVPEAQACCGAVHEHAGLPGKEALDEANRAAFGGSLAVLCNSSGCGLALRQAGLPQHDLVDFLNSRELRRGAPPATGQAYVDLPCHAVNGLGLKDPPSRLLAAAGWEGRWQLAPDAHRCCGSGGAYQFTHKQNSDAILAEKSAFLEDAPRDALVVTSNHVCMLQWSKTGVPVRHAVQLLDESYARAGVYRGI